MFKHIAEDIAFLLIKYKFIDIKDRDIYIFGLEALFLNISELIISFIISMLFADMYHFLAFVLVFLPLRITGGGFHFNNSSVCFVSSIAVYIAAVAAYRLCPLMYTDIKCIILLFITCIPILLFAPVENKNNPLTHHQKRLNRFLSLGFLFADIFSFFILKHLHRQEATNILIFVTVISILIISGKIKSLEDKILFHKEESGDRI